MDLNYLLDQFIKLSKKYALPSDSRVFKFLLKIEKSPSHYVAVDSLSLEEKELADQCVLNGYLDLVPKNHIVTQEKYHLPKKYLPTTKEIPERYVLTSHGSYALGTFDSDTYRDEENALFAAQTKNQGLSLHILLNNKHYGWFKWNTTKQRHIRTKDKEGLGRYITIDLADYL